MIDVESFQGGRLREMLVRCRLNHCPKIQWWRAGSKGPVRPRGSLQLTACLIVTAKLGQGFWSALYYKPQFSCTRSPNLGQKLVGMIKQ